LDLVDTKVSAKRRAWARMLAISSGPVIASESRIVLDVGREHQLAAGLIGRRGGLAFDHDGLSCARAL